MRVLVTGADGFIGRNLCLALGEGGRHEVLPVVRATTASELAEQVRRADAVIHLAGVNRPRDPAEFATGNADFTARLCELLVATGRPVPVAFASSIQADRDNPYGASKRAAEQHLQAYARASGAPVACYRLPNVFGKWSRPDYNSVVATFCHHLARGLPIRIDDPTGRLRLVYVDDVVAEFRRFLDAPGAGYRQAEAGPEYTATVGELAESIRAFRAVRDGDALAIPRVGSGLERALYATYVSFLPPAEFAYEIPVHGDARGVFVEMLKTPDCGQFSFFTAHPGVTRGGHYHHTKTEKFLVVQGQARYRFRHMLSGETHMIDSKAEVPLVVETVPGWAHDITNTGEDDLIVLLWANEVFDRQHPDTVASPL